MYRIPKNLKRFFQFLKPYKKRVIIALLFTLAGSIIGLANPYITKLLIDEVLINRNGDLLIWLVVITIAVFVVRKTIDFFRSNYLMIIGQRLFFDIAVKLTEKILNLSVNYHKRNGVGYLTSRITDDVEASQSILETGVISVLSNIFTFVVGTVVLFYLNVKLSILALAMLPIYIYSLHFYDGEIEEKSEEIQEAMANEMSILQEILSAHFTLSIFHRIKYELRKIVRIHKEVVDNRFKLFYSQFAISIFINLMTVIIPLIIMWFGVNEIYANKLTVGEYIAFTAYINMIYGPASSFADLHVTLRTVRSPINRIFEIIDMDKEVIEKENPLRLKDIKGNIKFDSVKFNYSEDDSWKLDDVSFSLPPGESIAIVGKSGSGKTTIVNLLSRFYDPKDGKILIDGINIKDAKLSDLRKSIGYVSQDSFLFDETIYNNIKYGNPHASKEEIIEACKKAHCYDFIMSFTDGFETKCGQRGVSLSGGQRQRISIARTLLKDPSILILDEATSSLDSFSEEIIQTAIGEIMQNRTTIMIAHRLSSIKLVDKIIVMDNGKIIDTGNHHDLSQRSEIYAELCKMQNISVN